MYENCWRAEAARNLGVTHRPQPQPPLPQLPTLTLHQSDCKLNIKPIILCIWVIVLARRVASTATSLAHTLQLMPCLMLGGCWCRGEGGDP